MISTNCRIGRVRGHWSRIRIKGFFLRFHTRIFSCFSLIHLPRHDLKPITIHARNDGSRVDIFYLNFVCLVFDCDFIFHNFIFPLSLGERAG